MAHTAFGNSSWKFVLCIHLMICISLSSCAVRPAIISRADWGAQPPNLNSKEENGIFDAEKNRSGWLIYPDPLADVLRIVVIHHSGLSGTKNVREIQRIHMEERGFADIGYHYVVNDIGEIFEGRTLSVRGAHVALHNTGAVGIVLLGNFNENPPSGNQLRSLKLVLQFLKERYRVTHIAGHLDFHATQTVCPGAKLESLLPQIARSVGLQFGVLDSNPSRH